MVWEKWQYEAAEMKRQEMLLRRGMMRMKQAMLARALATWKAMAEAARAEQEEERRKEEDGYLCLISTGSHLRLALRG